jgi:hypothetical protein
MSIVRINTDAPEPQTLNDIFIHPIFHELEAISSGANFPKVLEEIIPVLNRAGNIFTTAKPRQGINLESFRDEWVAETEICQNYVKDLVDVDDESRMQLYKQVEISPKKPGPMYDNFLAMLTFFVEFAQNETTTSPGECDKLRKYIARLQEQFEQDPKPANGQNDSSATYTNSYHFQNQGGYQNTNTGSGHQFNGFVSNPSFGTRK